MNVLFFVGDDRAAKGKSAWRASLGRMLLPGALFALSLVGALSPSDAIVQGERLAVAHLERVLAVHLDHWSVTRALKRRARLRQRAFDPNLQDSMHGGAHGAVRTVSLNQTPR